MQYMAWYGMIILCSCALGNGEEVAVTLVNDGHDTTVYIVNTEHSNLTSKTYPTRKSFPAAVPSATLVPAKWWTAVFESMA